MGSLPSLLKTTVDAQTTVDMKAWLKIFEELNLASDMSALDQAFQDNNAELFNNLLSNFLSNLSIKDFVKVKVKTKLSFVGEGASVGGILNGASDAMVAMVAIVAMVVGLALSNNSANGFMMCASAACALGMLLLYRKSSNKPNPTTLCMPEVRNKLARKDQPLHIQELMSKAKMENFTLDQEQLAKTLVQQRLHHIVTTRSKHIISSFVAKANSGQDLSYLNTTQQSTITKKKANEMAKEKILELDKSIDRLDDANLERKERYLDLAQFQSKISRLSKNWTDRLQVLEKDFGKVLSVVKSCMFVGDDVAVSKQALSRRTRLYDKIQDQVGELQKEVKNLSGRAQVLPVMQETISACRGMMTSIVHSSSLDTLQKNAMDNAMKDLETKKKYHDEEATKMETMRASIKSLQREIKQHELAMDREIDRLKSDLAVAQAMAHRKGQGYWKMEGKPNDKRSKEMKDHWDNGRKNKLEDYTSGDFQVKLYSDPEESQQKALNREKELRDDLSQKEQEKNQKKKEQEGQLEGMKKHLESCKETFKTAQKTLKEANKKLMVGMNELPPAQKGEVVGMQQVAAAMDNVGKKLSPAKTEMEYYDLLLEDLDARLEDKASVKSVLECVMAISLHSNDLQVSSMTLLQRLGDANINDFLLPAVDPADDDEKNALEAIVDESPMMVDWGGKRRGAEVCSEPLI